MRRVRIRSGTPGGAQVVGGVEVALVSDGTGAGRTGVEKKDVLPPLVPGAKPRRQD